MTPAARTVALALVLLGLTAGRAQAVDYRVLAVPGADTTYYLHSWAAGGAATGLLVPGAGAQTSEAAARASLLRGDVTNSFRPEAASTRPLIELGGPPFGAPARVTILVGVPQGGMQPNDRRYPIAVFGAGFDGVLVSSTTRIPGVVSIADVAPTALGRPGSLTSEPRADAVDDLLALDRRIGRNDDNRAAATAVAVLLVMALALVFPRAALLGVDALLAVNLVLGASGASQQWLVLAALGLAVAAGSPLLARALRSPWAIGGACAAVLLAYLVVLGVHGEAVALSPLGPGQVSRFYGLSNLLETFLLVPALAGAAFLAVRLGWAAFAGVAVVALVAVAGDRFGADGGGAVVVGVGFAVLAVLLAGARRRAVALGLAAAAAAVLGFLLLDAAAGGTSHVSRALESGPGGLAGDLGDRLAISWERATAYWYVGLLVGAVVVLVGTRAWLLLRRSDLEPGRRALPLAVAAALASSLVVNDTPNDVTAAGVAAFLAVEAVMLRDPCARFFSSSPSSLSLPWPAAAARGPSRPRPRP